ncbi:MAG: hypothetical protein J6W00_14745 [Lentisphaeria bacterium]|nr:hypothetical protein [Lentisphaeria bacterium]
MKKVTCSACRFYMKELNRCGWHGADCHNADGERWCDKFKQPTLFDRITASPEVLAEATVYRNDIGLWVSHFIKWGKNTKSEAIAATVAKLNAVCNE